MKKLSCLLPDETINQKKENQENQEYQENICRQSWKQNKGPTKGKWFKKWWYNQKIEVRQPLEILYSKNVMAMENASEKVITF